MNFRSYYGSTMREALNQARADLGQDASILASRQVDPGENLPGRFEVVAGVVTSLSPGAAQFAKTLGALTQPPSPAAGPARPPVARRISGGSGSAEPMFVPPPAGETNGKPASPLAQVRRKVNSIRRAVSPGRDADNLGHQMERLLDALRVDGFDLPLAQKILSGVCERAKEIAGEDPSPEALERLTVAELDARCGIEPVLGRASAKRRVTAVVGPPGAGKTSLVVKLAVQHGLTARRPLRLISLDGARVGGADALVRYAAGMAVPLDIVETGMALAQALEAHSDAGLVLIDTPGLAPGDMAGATEFASVLARHPEIDVHLTLPATMSAADLKAVFARFRPFLAARIAITHTDSAVSCRAAIGIALSHELPLSFSSTGPRIPADIAEASVKSLLSPAIPAGSGQARSAVA